MSFYKILQTFLALSLVITFISPSYAYAEETSPPSKSDPTPPAEVTNVSVPNVIRCKLPDAKQILSAASLGFVMADDNQPTTSTSIVTFQDPLNGMAPQGTKVKLWTKESEEAPTVTGMTLGYIQVNKDTGAEKYIPHPNPDLGEKAQIATRGGTLELLSTVTWSNGTSGYAKDQGVGVSWSTSNSNIATVSNKGVVTAASKQDGDVVITCTADDHTAPGKTVSASITIKVAGQSGAYVTAVAVTDASGKAYGEDRVILQQYDGSTSIQLYVTVQYCDGQNYYEKSTARGDKIDNLTWRASNPAIAYVNETTGLVRPLDDGQVSIYATVSGGLDGAVLDHMYLAMDTGKYKEGRVPSDTFTVHIGYQDNEKDPSGNYIDYETHQYNASSLAALGTVKAKYTLIKGSGTFATLAAQGVYISKLLATLDVVESEVFNFYFKATDFGAPQSISPGYLLDRASYYLPDYEAGLLSGAVDVRPMIAISTWEENDRGDADFSNLNGKDRFRLCHGPSGKTDNNAQKAFYNVSDMYITLKGSPPAGEGDGRGQGNGSGIGSGQGSGQDGQGGAGTVNGDPDTSNSSGDNGKDPSDTNATTGISKELSLLPATDAQAQQAMEESSATEGKQGESGSTQLNPAQVKKPRHQIYEMVSNAKSDIDPLEEENPYEPYALPAALAIMGLAAFLSSRRFSEELNPNAHANRLAAHVKNAITSLTLRRKQIYAGLDS